MKRKVIIMIVLLLALAGCALVYFLNNTGFRVLRRDPAGDVALSSTQIQFTMSEAITNKDTAKISIAPQVDGRFLIDGATVTFKPNVSFTKDTTYKVSFSNILTATSKDTKQTSTTFKAKYVEYGKLSQAEQQRQLQRTNPLYKRFPITEKVLPHVDVLYKIEYTAPLENATQLSVTITPLISIGSHETKNDYQQRLLEIRTKALDYITKSGYKPSDLLIYYNDPYLAQFNATQNSEEFSPPIQ
jgi:hypothetical protein